MAFGQAIRLRAVTGKTAYDDTFSEFDDDHFGGYGELEGDTSGPGRVSRSKVSNGSLNASVSNPEAPAMGEKALFLPLCSAMAILGFVGAVAWQMNCLAGAGAGVSLMLSTTWRNILLSVISLSGGAFLIYAAGHVKTVGYLLGLIVFSMLVCFALAANGATLGPGFWKSLVVPGFPENVEDSNSVLTGLSLFGTSAVWINFFISSDMARTHTLADMRIGVATSAVLAGSLSALVMVVGSTGFGNEFSLEALADILALRVGEWARTVFAFGLIGAAVSSALAIPLGTSITVATLMRPLRIEDSFEQPKREDTFVGRTAAWISSVNWRDGGRAYNVMLLATMILSLAVAVSPLDPLFIIFAAQVVNGLVLPFVCVALLLCVNDPAVMGRDNLQPLMGNVAIFPCVFGALLLASNGLLGLVIPTSIDRVYVVISSVGVALLAVIVLGFKVRTLRRLA